MRLSRLSLSALLALLAAAGCGGGGGGELLAPPGPLEVDLTLGQFGDATGAVVSTDTVDPSAGDTAANVERRAILRFRLDRLPAGATVLSATFRAEESGGTGNVFTGLGGFVVEAVDAGVVLDFASDFTGAPLPGLPVLLPTPAGLPDAVRTFGVTSMLQAARQAGLLHLDLRFRPGAPTDNDGADDLRGWNVLAPAGGVPPVVTVSYRP
jgi:hypothetical protein